MFMRKFCISIIVSLIVLIVAPVSDASDHPAVKMLTFYDQAGETPYYVNPYIVTILSIYSLHNKKHHQEVLDFINWFFARLNYPDMNGLTGTIYDYMVDGQEEKILRQYDSVDGYMGAFLVLFHEYVKTAGDTELIRKYRKKIDDMVYLIAYLQDSDGLTVAVPNTVIKFSMNNCESYAGVHAYNAMLAMLGEKSEYHQKLERTLKNAVVHNFYDKRRRNFSWALSSTEDWPSSWSKMYPDAYAQVLFITYRLLDDNPTLKRQVWMAFQAKWGKRIDRFPFEQQAMIRIARDRMR